MDFDTILQYAGLIGGGAAVGGGIVASVTGLLKNVLPTTWQHGRAVLAIVYALAAGLVIASMGTFVEPVPGGVGAAVLVGVLAWQGIAAAAVGTREITVKAVDIATGGTNPQGPDAG